MQNSRHRTYLGYVFGWERQRPRTPRSEHDTEPEPVAPHLARNLLHADEGDLFDVVKVARGKARQPKKSLCNRVDTAGKTR